jgi:hypothetical protein
LKPPFFLIKVIAKAVLRFMVLEEEAKKFTFGMKPCAIPIFAISGFPWINNAEGD